LAGSQTGFTQLIGQERVAKMLAAAVANQATSHAYLFTGPDGTGKMEAARELAAALCCAEGGCGRCDSCVKARRGTHPDIETVSPAGAFITVDQIRELNRSINLFPGEGRARVIIVTDAAALGAESANAFLKTLEEPPEFVSFIIMARRADLVLPTIVSRCQEVRFGPVPPAVIEEHLVGEYDESATMARTYAAISGGNLALAESFCRDAELRLRRKRYMEIAQDLTRGGSGPHLLAAEVMDMAGKAEEAEAAAADEVPEGFGGASSGRKRRDAHRRATAARKRELDRFLGTLQSWFRDMTACAAGAREAVINMDYALELEQEALESRVAEYRRAAEAVAAARRQLGYNIDLELALLALFHRLQEVL